MLNVGQKLRFRINRWRMRRQRALAITTCCWDNMDGHIANAQRTQLELVAAHWREDDLDQTVRLRAGNRRGRETH